MVSSSVCVKEMSENRTFLSRGKWWHVNLKKHGYDTRTNRLVMANLSSEHNLLVTLFECPNWFTVEINVKYKIVPD